MSSPSDFEVEIINWATSAIQALTAVVIANGSPTDIANAVEGIETGLEDAGPAIALICG